MSERITKKVAMWIDLMIVWPVLLWRWCAFGYTYRRIYLGEGIWTILEPADYYRLRQFKWVVNGNGHNFYAVRHKIVGPNKTWTISMHREIMNANDERPFDSAPPTTTFEGGQGRLVDHRNCNSLDNRMANLRFATQAENIHNRRKRKNTTSQYIGVFFRKDTRKWVAKIMIGRKLILLGNFDNEIDAARAYDEAAKKYHKEFARLNFPERSEAPIVLICKALSFGLYKSEGGGNQKTDKEMGPR